MLLNCNEQSKLEWFDHASECLAIELFGSMIICSCSSLRCAKKGRYFSSSNIIVS